MSFVDPKGLRNIDLTSGKMQLYQEIREIGTKLNDSKLELNAFIVTPTGWSDLLNVSATYTKSELEARHIFFGHNYLKKLFNVLVAA